MPRGKKNEDQNMADWYAAGGTRTGRQRKKRGVATPSEDRAALVERARLDLAAKIAADTRPITERVPEYVLDYDDDGNYVGLKRAT